MTSSINMDGEMFLRLLIEQLKNQDPMEPMSNGEMLAQFSQLATVESMNKMDSSFSDVLKFTRLSSGLGLVGRDIQYWSGDFLKSGTVESVLTEGGGVKLMIGEDQVEIDAVSRVF